MVKRKNIYTKCNQLINEALSHSLALTILNVLDSYPLIDSKLCDSVIINRLNSPPKNMTIMLRKVDNNRLFVAHEESDSTRSLWSVIHKPERKSANQ